MVIVTGETMINKLQSMLDGVKQAQDNGETEVRKMLAHDYVRCANFVESITGKTVESGGWKVRFKED